MIKEVTTRKAKELLINMPKKELAEVLGLSRPTLDTRLTKSNWKKTEI